MNIAVSLFIFFGFSVLLVIIAALYTVFYNSKLIRIDDNQVMEFKSSMDLCDLPVITLYQGKNKYHFLIDTGSNVSYINQNSNIERSIIEDAKDSFIGANGDEKSCDMANISVFLREREYNETFRIADLESAFYNVKQNSGISLTGIIGNDFMQKYKYCIDFKELIIYRRK